ncbi:MAG: N-6 DNA methylase [Treponema sp.]|nr:N-6 DNA methylase [Treponema sp.]
MRKTNIKGLGFDTIKLEGSIFTSEIVQHAVFGDTAKIVKAADADYKIPRGLRLLDEIGRSFKIARSLWENLEEGKLKEQDFIKEFFIDALSYSLPIFEKLVNINPQESEAYWYIICNNNYLRLVRKSSSLARPSYLEFSLRAILSENRFPDYQMLYRIMHGSRTLGLDNDGKGECIWDIWKKAGEELGVRVREGLRKGVTRALGVIGCGFLQYDSPGNAELRSAIESGELSAQSYFQELMRLMYRFLFIITVEERSLVFEHSIGKTENEQAEKIDRELHGKHTLYEKGYSLRRLRERSARYNTGTHYGDLWEGIKIVFRIFGGNHEYVNNPLDLPILGGLFKADQCPHLDRCGLSNANLLEAMYHLRWTVDGNSRTLIDYKNMGSEELGSVYESLLELVPQLDMPRLSFGFLGIEFEGGSAGNSSGNFAGNTRGNTRKTTGSYYTNASLVECLIKSNLDPLIEEKLAEKNEASDEQKILSITVIDPACGSGHFLLAAARRLAVHLAFIRANNTEPRDDVYRNSLRDVISSCIYGVDLNPMAVELARMALWLEGYEPGKPLSFLDHHIRCGNSIVGVMDFEVLSKGISDDAYKVLSGDDKECAVFYKKRNKNERDNKANTGMDLFEESIEKSTAELTIFHWKLENILNNNLADVEEKRALFENLHRSREYRNLKTACDLYVSAFYAEKKGKAPPFPIVPTSKDVQRASSGLDESQFSIGVNALAAEIAKENNFFHWRLEFPDVFQKGGFDCVLANPPWEVSQLNEEEFFAQYSNEISDMKGAVRKKSIKELRNSDIVLWNVYSNAKRKYETDNSFYHSTERFLLTAIGKINTYALFSETILYIKNERGRAGFIVPTGIATDDSTKNYFRYISGTGLVSLYSFENETFIFLDVHHSFKFCLISLGKSESSDLAFFLRNMQQLEDKRRHFSLSQDEFLLLNPNTLTCPIFRSEKDAELTKKIYRNVPVLIREKDFSEVENSNHWRIKFMTMFNMTTHSYLFHNGSAPNRLPLYEAKMMHQFDHRWATYTGSGRTEDVTADQKRDVNFVINPRYWVDKDEVLEKIAGDDDKKPVPKWLMGWRDITSAMNERTVIVGAISLSGVGNNMPVIISDKNIKAEHKILLYANFNSIVLDFVARHKTGGTHINFFIINQFPILPPKAYSQDDIDFIVPRVLELTYTAIDLILFAEDLWDSADPKMRMAFLEQRYGRLQGNVSHRGTEVTENTEGNKVIQSLVPLCLRERRERPIEEILPPFVFDPERRALLRAALDARYARLYGLSRDDLRYILDPADIMGPDYPSETFRVLKEREIAEFGEYRTRRLVLEAWDGGD